MIKFGFLLKLVSQHRSDVMFPFESEKEAKEVRREGERDGERKKG